MLPPEPGVTSNPSTGARTRVLVSQRRPNRRAGPPNAATCLSISPPACTLSAGGASRPHGRAQTYLIFKQPHRRHSGTRLRSAIADLRRRARNPYAVTVVVLRDGRRLSFK